MADVSSCFLSEPMDVTKYGMFYGGVQKNIGPAGMVIAVIREDLIRDDVMPCTPTIMKYKTQADANSLYNTPNCYCIYVCGKVFKWLKNMGGLEVMKQRNEEKAAILYDYLDENEGPDEKFMEQVKINVIDWLFGHIKTFDRSVAEYINIYDNPERL